MSTRPKNAAPRPAPRLYLVTPRLIATAVMLGGTSAAMVEAEAMNLAAVGGTLAGAGCGRD